MSRRRAVLALVVVLLLTLGFYTTDRSGAGRVVTPGLSIETPVVVVVHPTPIYAADLDGKPLMDANQEAAEVREPSFRAAMVPRSGSQEFEKQGGWWPFRYLTPDTPFWKLVARSSQQAPAAVCELMVLGHPLCDRFLTDPAENPVRHAKGAMVECIEEYGGVEAWSMVLQPQCTRSPFWQELRATMKAVRAPNASSRQMVDNDAIAKLMDPIARQHIGPIATRYVPVAERTYSPTLDQALVCAPPPLTESEERLAKQWERDPSAAAFPSAHNTSLAAVKTLVAKLRLPSFILPSVDGNTGAITRAHREEPLTVHPIALGFPQGNLVERPFRVKMFEWFPVTPGYYPPFRPYYFKRFKKRARYAAEASDEYIMSLLQRLSYFSWTHARGGPDCMRHYDILAAGAVPYFPDILLYPRWTLSHLPKSLLKEVHRLSGVQHIGSAEDILPLEEVAVYNQSAMPRWVRDGWVVQRSMLIDRLGRSVLKSQASAVGAAQPTPLAAASVMDWMRDVNKPPLFQLWDQCFAILEDRSFTDAVVNAFQDDVFCKGGVQAHRRWQHLFDSMTTPAESSSTAVEDESSPTSQCASIAADTNVVKFLYDHRGALGEADVITSHIPPPADLWEATMSEWAMWMLEHVAEEFHEEGLVPLHEITKPPLEFPHTAFNKFYCRVRQDPTFNFFGPGAIQWPSFSRSAYFKLADELHNYTKMHLTTAAVASTFLRTLQREGARRVLFFGGTQCDYTTFTLWHGLLALGLNVTSVPLEGRGSRGVREGPLPVPSSERRTSVLVREFGPGGARTSTGRLWGGEEYELWRRRPSVSLDEIYGRNFMVGRRIPLHDMISEAEGCRAIRQQQRRTIDAAGRGPKSGDGSTSTDIDQTSFDVIVLAFNHRIAPFGGYPCARDLRMLLRNGRLSPPSQNEGPAVAYVDGNDEFNPQTAASFFAEGITVFAREPKCW